MKYSVEVVSSSCKFNNGHALSKWW